MIGVSQLSKSFGGRTLFEGVSLQLNAGARYGLVGANGSGKTTFLKILAGDEPASDGIVAIGNRAHVGVLRQDRFLDDAAIILDLAMMGDVEVWKALQERERIIDHSDGDPGRLADIETTLRNFDGYTLEARATAVLEGLGIPLASHRLPLSTLSGGFKLRVLLAQVLVGGPDALLLDEPTNHLDILSIRWLEKFLAGYRGVALVISHDQRFLDNVATHILDVDYETITPYTGNYSAFVVEKEGTRERKEGEVARAEKIIADKRAFVDRFGAKASKAKQAQSRLKQIERIEVEELKTSSRRTPLFRFTPERPSGRDVLEVESLGKAYGDHVVLRDLSLTIRRGERIAVIGPNGLGKSTLLKIVTGHVTADSGKVRFGHEARPGYFAQDHHEILHRKAMTPLDYVWEACPTEGTSHVRGQLGRMLFTGDDVEKKIGSLSGGEAARLIFARIIVERPNVLVLDEPTNHLDLEAIHALSEGLKAYEGTVLFVSHDRWFVSEVATRILELTPTGPRDFLGTFAEYLERCGDDHLDADAVLSKAKETKEARAERKANANAKASANGKANATPTATATATATANANANANAKSNGGALSWEEQKKRRNWLNALPARRDKVLAAIDEAEARKKAIALRYAEPTFFTSASKDEIAALEREDKELVGKIERMVAEWGDIEKDLAMADAP